VIILVENKSHHDGTNLIMDEGQDGGQKIRMQNYLSRILRAVKLDAQLYEEVEADKTALGAAAS